MRRFLRWPAVLLAVVTACPAPAVAAACGRIYQVGRFTVIKPPPEVKASGTVDTLLAGMTVDPFDTRRVFVWTATRLFASIDSGCRWERVYAVAEEPLPYTTGFSPMIRGVVTGAHALSHRQVWAWVSANVGTTPVVLTSSDGRRGWAETPGQLPLPGDVTDLVPSAHDPDVLRANVVEYGQLTGVYTSADRGRTWTATTEPAGATGYDGFTLVEDPAIPGELWAHSPDRDGIWHSTDGGARWDRIERPAMAALAVAHERGRPARLVGAEPELPLLHRSDDGGRTWRTAQTPGDEITSLVPGPGGDVLLTVRTGSVHELYRYQARAGRFVLVPGVPLGEFRLRLRDRATRPSYWGTGDGHLLRYTP